jgi:hypothetical protein
VWENESERGCERGCERMRVREGVREGVRERVRGWEWEGVWGVYGATKRLMKHVSRHVASEICSTLTCDALRERRQNPKLRRQDLFVARRQDVCVHSYPKRENHTRLKAPRKSDGEPPRRTMISLVICTREQTNNLSHSFACGWSSTVLLDCVERLCRYYTCTRFWCGLMYKQIVAQGLM